FTVSGCDLFTCTSAIVTVTVLQNTLNPIANSDINNVLESGTTTGNVLTNDINPITGNNTQLTVTGIVTPSPLGTLIITNSLTGAYTFIPNASVELAQGITTTTSAIYNVCNVNGCTTAQIAITITGVNDAPIVSTVVSTINNTNPTGTIPGFFVNDPDEDVLTITAVSMQPNIGTLVINPNGEYVFTPDPQLNYVGTVQFVVSVCDPYTCTSTIVILNVAPKPTETENYVIPAGFSPNGDGTNDVFVITPLPSTVRTSLTVFNRWGNEIFATEDYQNDWGGQAGKGAIISRTDGLPAGTYFVVVTLEDASGKVSDKIYKSITIMK
ncbi:MAG: gliding motility-associated C-terminal domain-containing protein, partial [Bacteroidetes bacterium]